MFGGKIGDERQIQGFKLLYEFAELAFFLNCAAHDRCVNGLDNQHRTLIIAYGCIDGELSSREQSDQSIVPIVVRDDEADEPAVSELLIQILDTVSNNK
ncbi:hypothetical protein LZ554_009404 [Drepanopeziza brunnea f. sp. 'monogermtubi']|nr:hypothetical protein LZ554_009404 [Drepanopeziza brunnea f. sp. 'monogermtubi']